MGWGLGVVGLFFGLAWGSFQVKVEGGIEEAIERKDDEGVELVESGESGGRFEMIPIDDNAFTIEDDEDDLE